MYRTQPPDQILRNAKYTNKFFKLLTAAPHSEQRGTAFQLLTADENEAVSFPDQLTLLSECFFLIQMVLYSRFLV